MHRNTTETTTIETIDVHLIGGADPDGSIDLALFAPIAAAFDELSGRIVRWHAGRRGPGRPPAVLEQLATTRLVGVQSGSTTLRLLRGDSGVPEFNTAPVVTDSEDPFWMVLAQLAGGDPAPEVPDNVKESALKLADALGHAAPVCALQSQDLPHHRARLVAGEVRRSAWSTSGATEVTRGVFAGVLEAGNLRSARFAIRDDAGNRIRLGQVVDLDGARRLLGDRVVVEGEIHRIGADWMIEGPTRLARQPSLTFGAVSRLVDELDKDGPVSFDDAPEEDLLDDEQFAAFLEAARGA